MTHQTAAPLVHINLSATYRRAEELTRTYTEHLGLDLDPPYQRGQVWIVDQRRALVCSWLTGIPSGVVILADRTNRAWLRSHGLTQHPDGAPMYAVIDGKQRITTCQMWFASEFAVPASWFNPDDIDVLEDTDDGPYVRHNGLNLVGRRRLSAHALLQVAEAEPASLQDEAAIYLLVNGGGTPQSQADMDNAARIANPR